MSDCADMTGLHGVSPRRHHFAPALAAAAAVTLLIGLVVRYGSRAAGTPPAQADILTLLAVTAWIALAAAPLAAGAGRALGALLFAGIMADAAAVGLLVMGLTGPLITWSIAWRTYLIWSALAVSAAGVVRLADRPGARAALSLAFSTAAFAACSSLTWSSGLVLHLEGSWREHTATIAAGINPMLNISQLLRGAGFFWPEQPVMYRLTRMGQDYAAPAVAWHVGAAGWWILAAAAWATLLLRRAWRAVYWGT
jgi:hypothetical protein